MLRYLAILMTVAGAGICLFVNAQRVSAAPAYRAINLGFLSYQYASSPVGSIATAINNYGQVVGYSGTSEPFWVRGMLWQPDGPRAESGQLYPLSDVVGYPVSYAAAINERGQILIPNAVFTPDDPNGLSGTVASVPGVLPNNLGQVPNIYIPGVGDVRLVRTEADGSMTELQAGDHTIQKVLAINDFGQVLLNTSAGVGLWVPDEPGGTAGQITEFPNVHERLYHTLLLTEAGSIGISYVRFIGPPRNAPSALIWEPDTPNASTGRLIELQDLFGAPLVELIDMNNVGQLLVGLYEADASRLGYYLMTPDGLGDYERFRLDTLSMTLPDGSRFSSFMPKAMNDFGQIVGTASWSEDGINWHRRATLLVPEPSGMGGGVISLMLLVRRRSMASIRARH